MFDFKRHTSQIPANQQSYSVSGPTLKKAFVLQQKGDAQFLASCYPEAEKFYKKSLAIYRKSGIGMDIGHTLLRIGRTEEIKGEYENARAAYLESLELFQGLSDLQAIARCKAHLGSLGWATGDYAQAIILLEEARSLYRVAEDVPGEAWVHDLMGNIRLAMREHDEAERCYWTAYSMVEKLGLNLENVAWNHYHLGAVALYREQTEEAKKRFQEAWDCFGRLKDDLGLVAVLTNLGEIACAEKDFLSAGKHFREAVQRVILTGCKPLLADTLIGVAQLLKATGEERKAIGILMVALSHPTCRQQTKDRMVTLVMALESRFSQAEVEDGFLWAKDFSLEDMASAWVSSSQKQEPSRKRTGKKPKPKD
jgi:tetratricopeptide (TPR) repeat protein